MKNKPIILYGVRQPWDDQKELLLARHISNGIAQLATPPFATFWTGMGDIVAYDVKLCIRHVIIKNSRTYFGTYDVKGLNAVQIGRKSERLGRYLSRYLIPPLFTNHFPGVFSISADRRLSLKRILAIADQAPAPFEIVRPCELGMILKKSGRGLESPA